MDSSQDSDSDCIIIDETDADIIVDVENLESDDYVPAAPQYPHHNTANSECEYSTHVVPVSIPPLTDTDYKSNIITNNTISVSTTALQDRGESPTVCSHCGASFSDKNALINHLTNDLRDRLEEDMYKQQVVFNFKDVNIYTMNNTNVTANSPSTRPSYQEYDRNQICFDSNTIANNICKIGTVKNEDLHSATLNTTDEYEISKTDVKSTTGSNTLQRNAGQNDDRDITVNSCNNAFIENNYHIAMNNYKINIEGDSTLLKVIQNTKQCSKVLEQNNSSADYFRYDAVQHNLEMNDCRNTVAVPENIVKRKIYKCSKCFSIILHKRNIFSHKCTLASSLLHCDICNQYYLAVQKSSHAMIHAKDPNFKKGNYDVEIFDPVISVCPRAIDYEIKKSNEILHVDTSNKLKIYEVYKCVNCRVTEFNKNKIEIHICVLEKDRRTCQICKHQLNYRSLGKHGIRHKNHRNFIAKNFNVNYFDPRAVLANMVNPFGSNCTQNEEMNNHNANVGIDEIVDETADTEAHITMSTAQISDNDTNTDLNTNSCDLKQDNEERPIKNKIYKCNKCGSHFTSEENHRIKCKKSKQKDAGENREKGDQILLFKCVQCDVYFLTQGDCINHTQSHIELDRLDYNTCKGCGLQFLNEDIWEHVLEHHKNKTDVESAVVEEYTPIKGEEARKRINIVKFVEH